MKQILSWEEENSTENICFEVSDDVLLCIVLRESIEV